MISLKKIKPVSKLEKYAGKYKMFTVSLKDQVVEIADTPDGIMVTDEREKSVSLDDFLKKIKSTSEFMNNKFWQDLNKSKNVTIEELYNSINKKYITDKLQKYTNKERLFRFKTKEGDNLEVAESGKYIHVIDDAGHTEGDRISRFI